jgi:hypothetical protein
MAKLMHPPVAKKSPRPSSSYRDALSGFLLFSRAAFMRYDSPSVVTTLA